MKYRILEHGGRWEEKYWIVGDFGKSGSCMASEIPDEETARFLTACLERKDELLASGKRDFDLRGRPKSIDNAVDVINFIYAYTKKLWETEGENETATMASTLAEAETKRGQISHLLKTAAGALKKLAKELEGE